MKLNKIIIAILMSLIVVWLMLNIHNYMELKDIKKESENLKWEIVDETIDHTDREPVIDDVQSEMAEENADVIHGEPVNDEKQSEMAEENADVIHGEPVNDEKQSEMAEENADVIHGEPVNDEKQSETVEENKNDNNAEKQTGITGNFIDYSKDNMFFEGEYGDVVGPENTLKYTLLKEVGYFSSYYKCYLKNEDGTTIEKTDLLSKDKTNPYKYLFVNSSEGDGNSWGFLESNYDKIQENTESYSSEKYGNLKIGKYVKPIEVELAELRMSDSSVYDDSYTLNQKTAIMWRVLEENVIYLSEEESEEEYRKFIDAASFSLTGISIMNGDNTREEEYNNHARAKKILVTIDNKNKYIFNLEDTNKPQLLGINYEKEEIMNPINIKIEVLEIYPGLKTDDVYINELGFGVDSKNIDWR